MAETITNTQLFREMREHSGSSEPVLSKEHSQQIATALRQVIKTLEDVEYHPKQSLEPVFAAVETLTQIVDRLRAIDSLREGHSPSCRIFSQVHDRQAEGCDCKGIPASPMVFPTDAHRTRAGWLDLIFEYFQRATNASHASGGSPHGKVNDNFSEYRKHLKAIAQLATDAAECSRRKEAAAKATAVPSAVQCSPEQHQNLRDPSYPESTSASTRTGGGADAETPA